MSSYTELFREVGRPVVVNLRANHFVGEGALVDELVRDESSFALINNGLNLREVYYTNTILAPTFSIDDRIPLNKYRFGGFRQAVRKLAEFDRESPGLIYAVTLAGELHHFLPELANSSAQGRFEGALMTDYSSASIEDFRNWLRSRYGSIAEVNSRFGTAFESWDELDPPRIDIRGDSSEPLWTHMDSYADGILPVFGWAEPNPGSEILVYIDNLEIGRAEYGLSRTDVYEAIDRLGDSDVGFRYDLNYRLLSSGQHVIHVVLRQADGSSFLIGRRALIVGRNPCSPAGVASSLDEHRPAVDERGGFAWLDHPPEGLSLVFNPYAAEWQSFRECQVDTLLEKFASIAVEEGFDRKKLYSHQIMPQFEGTWNRLAFAVAAKSPQSDLFAPGVDLYGGAAVYRHLSEFVKGKAYGVTECHPRMGKAHSMDIFRRTLEYHRKSGARFISPYYVAMRNPVLPDGNLVSAMVIHPLNPAYGSMFYYSALVEFLNKPSG